MLGRYLSVGARLGLPVAAVFVVLTLAIPATGATPAVSYFAPPYGKFSVSVLHQSWVNRTGGGTAFSYSSNRTTGAIGMSVSASHRACSSNCAATTIHGLAGYQFLFHVASGGAHQVSANWSVSWIASAYAASLGTFAKASGQVVLVVSDHATGSVLASTSVQFVAVNTSGATKIVTGCSRTLTLLVSISLTKGHEYTIRTYVDGTVYTIAGLGRASGSVSLLGARGATLHWVSIS